jgi:hypothetical protein
MSGSHSVVVPAPVLPAAAVGDNAGRVGARIGEDASSSPWSACLPGSLPTSSIVNEMDESRDGQLRQVAMGVVHCQ